MAAHPARYWGGFGGRYNVSIEIAQLTCAVEEIYIQLFSLALLLHGSRLAVPPSHNIVAVEMLDYMYVYIGNIISSSSSSRVRYHVLPFSYYDL